MYSTSATKPVSLVSRIMYQNMFFSMHSYHGIYCRILYKESLQTAQNNDKLLFIS